MSEEAVTLLQRLIACDTSNPPGDEAQAAAILEDFFEPAGVECERVAKDPRRPNLIARLPGRGEGPSLAFLGHLDVVQARREDWSVEPFGGVRRDGAVWGRGAIDMKCQVAATATALATLGREGFVPGGDLMLLLMADEEVGDAGVGAPYLVEQLPSLCPDYVVGEGAGERFDAPGGPVYLMDHGVKASASASLVVTGRAADASLPANEKESAAFELARLLVRLRDFDPPRKASPEVMPLLRVLAPDAPSEEDLIAAARRPDLPLAMIADALLRNVTAPTVVEAPGPANAELDRATVTIQCAVRPGTTKGELERELRDALGPGRYELEVSEPHGGLTSRLDSPLQHAIEEFLQERDPEARLVPTLGYGYSDCHTIRTAYGSIAYGFIPFRHADPVVNLKSKHGVDERVLVEDLAFQVDAALHIARFIGSEGGVATG